MKFPRLVLVPAEQGRSLPVAAPLVGHAKTDNPVPWVALATGHDGDWTFGDDPALMQEALENTRSIPFEWTVAAESGFLFWKKPSMLRAHGDLGVSPSEMATDGGGVDDLSTDIALNPEALKAAAETLNAHTIAVAAPKRGWILVAAAEPGDIGATSPLFEAAGGIASRGGSDAISGSAVVFYRDGQTAGIEVREGQQGHLSLVTRPEEEALAQLLA